VEFLAWVVVCAVTFILFTRSRHVTEKTETLAKENLALREQLRGILLRVAALEKALENLSQAPESSTVAAPEPEAPKTRDVPAAAVSRTKFETPVETPPIMATSIPGAPAETKLPEPSFERMRPADPSIPAAQPVARGPNFGSQIYSEAKKKDPRSLADLEERLGANWLNKIGTAAFVIGVALLLSPMWMKLLPQTNSHRRCNSQDLYTRYLSLLQASTGCPGAVPPRYDLLTILGHRRDNWRRPLRQLSAARDRAGKTR
jgi:hypothetical protein